MKIFKWFIPIFYFTFWAFELILNQTSLCITDLISSYAGYHAIILHFTIYLILELLTQIHISTNNDMISLIRTTRFTYILKDIYSKIKYSFIFTVLFYLIYSLVMIYRYGIDFYIQFHILKLFCLCIGLYFCFYLIMNIIQSILSLFLHHIYTSVFITFMIPLFVYFVTPQLLYHFEIIEKIYITQLSIQEYLLTILVLLIIVFILTCLYIILFLRKDLVHYENK